EQPTRIDLLFELGKALENLGDIPEAIPYLIDAENKDKENLDIKVHLAKDFLALKRYILAEKTLKRILKIEPEHEVAKELLKQCG
ncbi:MAG: tetratricopeptide repeat protein, partial [Pseudomonadota bacterium]